MDKKQRILWGGATASSQYEGGFTDSKGLDTQDCRAYLPRTSNATEETRLLTKEKIEEAKRLDSGKYYPFRNGTKGFEHLEEDIEYLDELGLDLYRFSISWARLFPNGVEEVPSPEGVAYYDRVFNLLTEKKIKIFLTLNHYAMPIYLVEQYGGWKGRECIEHFMRFATFVFERWGNLVEYWLPFNEINAGYFSPYNGVGLLKGEIQPMILPNEYKIPHIGWNKLHLLDDESRILKYVNAGEYVYFVHSYHARKCKEVTRAVTDYGDEITAVVEDGNVFGCQFHPEKSSTVGLRILQAFSEID